MSFSSFTLLIPWSPLTEAAPTHLQRKQKLRETKPQCWSMGLVLEPHGTEDTAELLQEAAGTKTHTPSLQPTLPKPLAPIQF